MRVTGCASVSTFVECVITAVSESIPQYSISFSHKIMWLTMNEGSRNLRISYVYIFAGTKFVFDAFTILILSNYSLRLYPLATHDLHTYYATHHEQYQYQTRYNY